jgi:hypothetical protein
MRTTTTKRFKTTPGFACEITDETRMEVIVTLDSGRPFCTASSISEAEELILWSVKRGRFAAGSKLTVWGSGIEDYVHVATYTGAGVRMAKEAK